MREREKSQTSFLLLKLYIDILALCFAWCCCRPSTASIFLGQSLADTHLTFLMVCVAVGVL